MKIVYFPDGLSRVGAEFSGATLVASAARLGSKEKEILIASISIEIRDYLGFNFPLFLS